MLEEGMISQGAELSMFVRLFLLLIVVPIAELFVLLSVFEAISERSNFQTALLVTVGAILGTGILGAALARSQGLGVLRELQQSLDRGKFPGRHLIDGVLVLTGGALLLIPGFLTDLVGLSLLVPISRNFYRRLLNAWLVRSIQQGEARVRFHSDFPPGADRAGWEPRSVQGRVIDVTPEEQD